MTSEHTLCDDLAFYINRNDKEKNIRVVLILNQLLGLVYIGIKKGNKIIIKENRFKSKNRHSIQKITVKTALKIINGVI